VDLALGHVKALQKLSTPQCTAINLGAGKGYSVLEVINAFSNVSGKEIPYVIQPRREGDIAACYSNSALGKELLGWSAKRDLDTICQDMWRFQMKNPKGYES
jgi:UDP-glucose 4-epimerase